MLSNRRILSAELTQCIVLRNLLTASHPALVEVIVDLIGVDVLPQRDVLLDAGLCVVDVQDDFTGIELQDSNDVSASPDGGLLEDVACHDKTFLPVNGPAGRAC